MAGRERGRERGAESSPVSAMGFHRSLSSQSLAHARLWPGALLLFVLTTGQCSAFMPGLSSMCRLQGWRGNITPHPRLLGYYKISAYVSPAVRRKEIVGNTLSLSVCSQQPFPFYTEDGRVVQIFETEGRGVGADWKSDKRLLTCEEMPRALKINSGEFGEYFDLESSVRNNIVRFNKMGTCDDKEDEDDAEDQPSSMERRITLRLRGGNKPAPDIPITSIPTSTINTHNVSKSALMDQEAQRLPKTTKTTSADGGRPLRIAIFTWESLHTVAVGGVAPHVTELAAGLERRGHEVHVYSRTGHGQLPYEIIDGVHIHRVPMTLDPDFIVECANMCNSMCWFMCESEKFQGAFFDLVHGHDWLTARAVMQCKSMGRRTVTTVHSTEYGRCGNAVYGGQSERIRTVEETLCHTADRVISVSGVLCDEIKNQFGIPTSKLRMIYNGIHLDPYQAKVDAGAVKARIGIGPLEPMVLFVGRLAMQKGPDLLLEAIPLVLATRSDVKFVIVGDGYMKNDLQKRAHDLGVASSVRFLGSMSGRPLVELFKSTDCVCIPSRNEPFGIVVLESWASEKPVVVTSSGGPREFVSHGVDGYHVHPHPNSIAWGICEVFNDFDHSRQMGVMGRDKAQSSFNWNAIAAQTELVYRELCGY